MAFIRYLALLPVVALLATAGCTPAPEGQSPGEIHDPYEAVNRRTHAFNKTVDTVALRPAAEVAGTLTPQPLRMMVTNAAENLSTPSYIVNQIMQGRIKRAGTNTARFVINSTLGLGGLMDPATELGIPMDETDFGETLHVLGAGEGAYIELPLLGPSNVRDGIGEVVDIVLDPVGQLGAAERRLSTGLKAGEIVYQRHQFGDTIDGLLYDSADSYAQARLLYLQNRRFELGDARPEEVEDPFALDTEGF